MKSIAFKLWAGMMMLVVIVLILLWFFQIVFLESFYMNHRINSIKSRGINIIEDIDSITTEELKDRLDSFIYDYNCSIDYMDSNANNIYSNSPDRRMPMMMNSKLELLERILSGETVTTKLSHPRFNNNYMAIGIPVMSENTITGALLINMPIAPVKDTTEILKKQLIYISIILFVTALIISFLMSRSFVRPIHQITQAADEMASGNLSVRLKIKSKDEIGKLSRAINHLGVELSKIEQLRRDFIANVSHELRTPLSLIRGYAETIRDVTGNNEEKRLRQLGVIVEETDRLSRIVDDILDLSQMQSNEICLSIIYFNVNDTILNVKSRYDILCDKLGVTIHVESVGSTLVKGDEIRIQQVLHNLINNALSYSEAGSFININTQVNNSIVRIEVSDTGEGISPDEISFIWERYYKGDKEGGKRVGTGLGLAIVKNILEAHNSEHGVKSVKGEGTTFWFELEKASTI